MSSQSWPSCAASYLCKDCGLIPIWPCFASMIYSGVKKFEYRKRDPRKNVKTFFIYETYPTSAITGVMIVNSVLSGDPEMIWEKTFCSSGVNRHGFISYYAGKKIAYALKIETTEVFSSPIFLYEIGLSVPQTIRYLS